MAIDRRRVDSLARRCYVGLGADALRDEVLAGLRQVVPIDAAFFATVDPATILFTSALAEEPLLDAQPLFLANEFGRDDVNKFAELAFGTEHVSSLDAATHGSRRDSARYTEVMATLGLGDELRAALVARGRCWGVLCLHRADGAASFTAQEVDLVRRLAPHLAEGLRRAMVAVALTTPEPTIRGPGVILLNEDMSIGLVNPAAHEWLAELADPRWMDQGAGPLPAAIHAAASQVAEAGLAPFAQVTRLRTQRGHWLTVHASRLDGPTGPATAVVLERATPTEMASFYLDAHGLTSSQSKVAALVLQGRSTRQIMSELQISSYTVQEHLRAVFDKFGVGSRRELVALLLGVS